MTACAVVVFDKPAKGSFDASISVAFGEVGMLRSGASEVHGVLSFDGVIMTENGSGARITLLFFQPLAWLSCRGLDHPESRPFRGQCKG